MNLVRPRKRYWESEKEIGRKGGKGEREAKE